MVWARACVRWFSTTWGVAVLLGLLSAGLRLPLALTSPLWQDEAASARILSEPTFLGVLRHVVRTESTPPLWYLLGWVVHRGGVPIYDVRLLSVAENGLLVGLVVVASARLFALRFAAIAGLLVAFGAEFSAEGRWIRAYELFALLAVLLGFAVFSAALAPTKWRLTGLVAVVAAGSLTHYFFLFTVAAAIVWLWFDPFARTTRRRTVTAVGAGLVPFALWSPRFLEQLRARRYSWIGGFDAREVAHTPMRLFTPFGSGGFLVSSATAVLILCAWGGSRLWARGSFARLCLCLAIAPLALAAGTWLIGVRAYAVRNMIGIGPFVAITAVAGLAALPKPAKRFAPVVILALVAGSFAWSQHSAGPAFNRIAGALVAEGWRTGDAVVVYGNRTEYRSPLGWYLPGHPNLISSAARHLRPPVFVVGSPRLVAVRTIDVVSRHVASLMVARVAPARGLKVGRGASIFLSPRSRGSQ